MSIDGVTHSLNVDFAQSSLLVAQQLGVSERYAASLLQAGFAGRARWGRPAPEVACILYHRERLAAIDCLRVLVSAAATLPREEDPLARKLGAKMRQLLDALLGMTIEIHEQSSAKRKGHLAERLLAEIDDVKAKMARTQSSFRGALQQQQQSSLLSQQQQQQQQLSSSLGDEIQIRRIEMMNQERQGLGHVLYLLAYSRMLPAQGLLAIVRWLSSVKDEQIQQPQDAMTTYVLTALLGALEVDEDAGGANFDGTSHHDYAEDRSLLKQLHSEFTGKTWATPHLQNVVVLQWSLFLVEATKQNPGLASELRIHEDSIQKLVLDAIAGSATTKGDAFYYLVLRVLAFRTREIEALEGEENDIGDNEPVAQTVSTDTLGDEEIDKEFQEYVLLQVQNLVLRITSVMLPFLRRLQRSEEDASFAASRGIDASRGGSDSVVSRRYDIEALFDTVTTLCKRRPESGLPFWLGPEGKGTRFLSWAVDVRETGHQRALLEMLAALSAGVQSAWHAHTLLSSGDGTQDTISEGRLASWSRLFDWVQHYIDFFRAPSAGGALLHAGTRNEPPTMPSNDAYLLRAYFRLLRNVALYSVAAREALYQHAKYQIIPRLFALYTCPIDIELKASILDALAAFAHPTGSNASKIAAQLWTMLESSQVLGTSSSGGGVATGSSMSQERGLTPRGSVGPGGASFFGSGASRQSTGAHHDLETIETAARMYPVTTSFVNFLKSLTHVPARAQDPIKVMTGSDGAAPTPSLGPPYQGLVLNLGQGQRSPGLEPYVSFVVDTVLLQAGTREYSYPTERWQVTATCLDFVERCLVSYDLSALLSDQSPPDAATLSSMVLHPGFSIMKRILTGTKLFHEVLAVLNVSGSGSTGFEVINNNQAKTLFFASSVRHAMRIVQRVLRIQDVFLQVLLPTLAEAAAPGSSVQFVAIDVAGKVGQLGSYDSLDNRLLHAYQTVVQIALYINCNRDDIALLSVRILGLIARSPAFSTVDKFGDLGYHRKMNRLVGLLEMSDEADRVRAGFVDRLEAESGSDPDSYVRATQALLQIAGENDEEAASSPASDELEGLIAPTTEASEAIRLAILDLLLANTSSNVAAPNVAHLLLGFDLRAVRPEEQTIPDPDSADTAPGALHAILSLMRQDTDDSSLSLAERAPAFAEKCHALIARLCTHSFTSAATLRYLRTKENFFVRQLRSLSYYPIERTTGQGALGNVTYADGGHISTTVDALVASLKIRAHLLGGAALELHTLLNHGMQAQAARLIATLHGTGTVEIAGEDFYDDDDDEEEEEEDFKPSQMSNAAGSKVEQRPSRILELLASFDFEWHDERENLGESFALLANLNFSQARRSDADVGSREYDIHATLELLAAARKELERRGQLVDARQRALFEQDATLVLQRVCARNAVRGIAFARRSAMTAWCHTLDMIFTRADYLLRPDARAHIIFDCLGVLLPRLSGPTPESDPALSDLVAGAVLALLTKLRHHRNSLAAAAVLDLDEYDDLPFDRLVSLLRILISALIRPGTSVLARGNLYSALINYLQLVKSSPKSSGDDAYFDDGATMTASVVDGDLDDSASFAGFSSVSRAGGGSARSGTASALVSKSRALLASSLDRLIPVIARDALDAADVWRTVAFTLLDRLCALESPSGESTKASRTVELLSKQGFLKSFVASIREMDLSLQDVLRPDPTSLNALYVYEAQMAFFNRLALTRDGADRLVEARIFDILTQADFLAARPEDDQEFVDLDSFLPAAMERYEALLGPVLQLSVSILSSAAAVTRQSASSKLVRGSSSLHIAPRQALSFLEAHSGTLLTSLKAPIQDATTLAAIGQAQLIVAILVFVLPAIDDDALSPPNPLSSFHASTLALAASFLCTVSWRSRVLPRTEAEEDDATRVLLGPGQGQDGGADAESVFDLEATRTVSRLVSTMLSYLEQASEARGRSATSSSFDTAMPLVRPCFTSSLFVPAGKSSLLAGSDDFGETLGLGASTTSGRYGLGSAHHRSMAVPSLGIALAALEEQLTRLSRMLVSMETAQSMLSNADNVRLDEWDEIVRDALGSDDFPDELGPAKRQSLALRELKARKVALKSSAMTTLDAIEMILVLLYRHFDYYLSLPPSAVRSAASAAVLDGDVSRYSKRNGGNGGLSSSIRAGSVGPPSASVAYETAPLVREGSKAIQKVLQRLEEIIMVSLQAFMALSD